MEFLPINTFQEIESIFQNDEENQNQRKMADTYRKLRIQNQKTKHDHYMLFYGEHSLHCQTIISIF